MRFGEFQSFEEMEVSMCDSSIIFHDKDGTPRTGTEISRMRKTKSLDEFPRLKGVVPALDLRPNGQATRLPMDESTSR